MALHALAVFGSFARGDQEITSDLDMLGISLGSEWMSHADARLSLRIYTEDAFVKMATSGSLFVWHVQQEGVVVYDSRGWLRRILDDFQLRDSYSAEREEAAQLGWCLHLAASDSLSPLERKTLLYVIRTVAFSVLAERGLPAFSRSDAVTALDDSDLDSLWGLKRQGDFTDHRDTLAAFLSRYASATAWQSAREVEGAARRLPTDSFARMRMLALLRVTPSGGWDY